MSLFKSKSFLTLLSESSGTSGSHPTPIDRAHGIELKELRFHQAQFTYRGASAPLFDKLDLSLPMGKNVWITGAAGAGQSTLLKLITVVTPLSGGSYFVNGQDAAQMSFEEFLHFRLKIGYTFDFGGLFSNRNLLENLALPMIYHKVCSIEDAESFVRTLADRFRFTSHLLQRPALVSGGLRKLVCILRATMLSPEMLVMDDPFTAIDSETARNLIRLLDESRVHGKLKHVFFTSREETWAAKLDAELLVIENGFAAEYSANVRQQAG